MIFIYVFSFWKENIMLSEIFLFLLAICVVVGRSIQTLWIIYEFRKEKKIQKARELKDKNYIRCEVIDGNSFRIYFDQLELPSKILSVAFLRTGLPFHTDNEKVQSVILDEPSQSIIFRWIPDVVYILCDNDQQYIIASQLDGYRRNQELNFFGTTIKTPRCDYWEQWGTGKTIHHKDFVPYYTKPEIVNYERRLAGFSKKDMMTPEDPEF
jgi:hypothetical protein